MQVQVESVGNLERRMTLHLPAERLETQVGSRLREIARTARIKGFRPGKVPTKVVVYSIPGSASTSTARLCVERRTSLKTTPVEA